MKKTLRRAAALLLCLVMTVGLLPAPAIAVDGVAINAANFPDEIFRLYVANRFDYDGDGYLSEEEIGAGYYDEDGWYCDNSYGISVYGSNISSLKGIEHFTGLTYLYCDDNKLTSLDLSKNTLLETLHCSNNQLTSLNVSNNKELTELDCSGNKLTALDVSKNTELTYLDCYKNKLTTLDVSKNTELGQLYCDGNKLTTLDVSKNTALRGLSCYGNPIGKLDIRNNPQLMQAVKLGIKEFNYDYYYYDDSWIPYVRYYISALDCSLSISRTTRLQTGSTEPPSVTTQPKDVSAAVGKNVTLSVTAKGSGLKYQWYKDDKPISGANSSSLTVTVKEDMYKPEYFCEVSNTGGVVCSETAVITVVRNKPVITTQPKNASVKAGKKVTFKVKAAGEGLKYQWYRLKPGTKKWEKIKKATKASYSFKAAKKWNGYKFRCVVSNAAGKVTSKSVKLKVKK